MQESVFFGQKISRSKRDEQIKRYEELVEIRAAGVKDGSLSSEEKRELILERRRVMKGYFQDLPRMGLSRCPVCGEILVLAFDPWGVDGYWWQEKELVSYEDPEHGDCFAVLTGAMSLNSKQPKGGLRYPAHVGPDVPYVIPRILEMPTMVAVISSVRMACGYTAYPIAYFTEKKPLPGTLTQTWRRTTYNWIDSSGEPAWSAPRDPWDFELDPWIKRGKILWITPGDDSFTLRSGRDGECPYVNLPGSREQLLIKGDGVITLPPPIGDEVDPFNEG